MKDDDHDHDENMYNTRRRRWRSRYTFRIVCFFIVYMFIVTKQKKIEFQKHRYTVYVNVHINSGCFKMLYMYLSCWSFWGEDFLIWNDSVC